MCKLALRNKSSLANQCDNKILKVITRSKFYRWKFLPLALLSLIMIGQANANTSSTDIRPLPSIYKTGKAINYSPFRNQGPDTGSTLVPAEVVTNQQVLQDLFLLNSAGYNLIRLFGSDTNSQTILSLAQKYYPWMKFQLGISLANTCANSATQVTNGINYANTFKNVAAVSVGNETAIAIKFVIGPVDPLPVTELATCISQVRDAVKQPVTTDQIFDFWSGLQIPYTNPPQDPSTILPLVDFVA